MISIAIVKIVLVMAYLTWDIWGVLATHNPSSHLFMVCLTATCWLKLEEQIVDTVVCSWITKHACTVVAVCVLCVLSSCSSVFPGVAP